MKQEIVTIDHKEFGLEENKAKEIAAQFKPMLDKMEELESEANEVFKMDINDIESSKSAKEIRLKYVKVRTGTAEIHKAQKAFYLAGGRFIDGWKNAQVFASQGVEERLMAIEKHAENLEKERIEKVESERILALAPYSVENVEVLNLGLMPESVWENFLSGTKTNYETRIAAEKRVEEERIANEKEEAKERERIANENEKLKKEAREREKKIAAENAERIRKDELEQQKRDAIEKLRLEKEEDEQKRRDEILKKEKMKHELRTKEMQPYIVFIRDYDGLITAEDKDYKAQLAEIIKGAQDHWEFERTEQIRKQKEQEAGEKAQRELREKNEQEAKAKQDEEDRLQSELKKGDAAKLKDFVNDLSSLRAKYTFKSKKYKLLNDNASVLIGKIIDHLNK